jgi:hypothetical protein
VIAEVLALVADADVLARIGGPHGEAAREAQRELARLDEKASRVKRASWLAAARTPLPVGLRGIDASWIEGAIQKLGTVPGFQSALAIRVRRVLADGPATPGDVWLANWVCAGFPPMPPIDASIARPRSIGDAVRTSATALRAWLEDVGADQVAFAVGASAAAMSSRIAEAAVRIAKAPRVGELGERRSAIQRARIEIDANALVRVGARAIAPQVGSVERLQLAHRLPHELGVLDELEAFAGSAGAPSWRALAAT